ncbi:MAG: radical SAM peptide maturase [Parabacteroides sp.]|nr:radical SAM peptide maturase [Parabacteroides sp.]
MNNIIHITTSDHENNYLYNRIKSQLVYVHPVLKLIISMINNGEHIDAIVIEKIHEIFPDCSNEDFFYYKKKYSHWKKSCLYDADEKYFHNHTVVMNPFDIKKQLANINQIVFEVTDDCNLNCYYCGYGQLYDFYDKRDKVNLEKEKAFDLIDYLSDLWNSSLNTSHGKAIYISFYGGEPLMNVPLIQDIIDYFKTKKLRHCTIKYSMTTNAILLKKYIDFLIKYDFDILVSIDGDRYNNSYRVFKNNSSSFGLVYENVKYVKKKYPDYFYKKVAFNSVLHNRNSVNDIYFFVKKHFDKIPSIGELNLMGVRNDKKNDFYKSYRNIVESLHQQEDYSILEQDMFVGLPDSKSMVYFLYRYTGNHFSYFNDFFTNKDKISYFPTGTCFPFSRKVFLTTSGKILQCERIPHKFSLGKIDEFGVSLDFDLIAIQLGILYSRIVSQCMECYRSDGCSQCIFYLTDIDYSEKCSGFTNKQMFETYFGSSIYRLENNSSEYARIVNEITLL